MKSRRIKLTRKNLVLLPRKQSGHWCPDLNANIDQVFAHYHKALSPSGHSGKPQQLYRVSQGGSTTKEDSGIFCLPSGGKISRSPPQPSLGHPHTCIWTGHWHSWIIFINPSIFVCFGIVPVLTVRQRHVLDPACWKLLCSSLAPGFSKGKKSPLISRYRTVVLFFFFPIKIYLI